MYLEFNKNNIGLLNCCCYLKAEDNSELGMTNLFDKNRPFINLNSNYNLDINFGSVHVSAQNNPWQVTFSCCLKKPCADSKNIYSKTIVK